MKKLLVITDSFLPRWDGVSRFLSEVLPPLAEDWQITVLAPEIKKSTTLIFPHIHVVRFPTYSFTINDFPIAKPAKKAMLPFVREADLVFVQSLSTLGMSGILAAKKERKPVLAYTHVIEWEIVPKSLPVPHFIHVLIGWIVKKWIRYFYNQCTTILVPTNEMLYVLDQEHILPVKTVVPLGINSARFVPSKDKRQSKTSLGLNPDNLIMGYCGRLGREKNLITLYKAFTQLQKMYKNITLLIVGKGVAEETAIFTSKTNVVLTGEVDNVVPYLQAMDIFVLPSLTETTSLATLEAMSCGVPVVCTPVGAIKEYITNGENGFLFPKQNDLVLRKKLEWLIANQKGRERMGMHARHTVEEKYSLTKTIHRLKSVLHEFIRE